MILAMVMVMMAKLMAMTYIKTMFSIINDQDDDFDHITLYLIYGYINNFEIYQCKMLTFVSVLIGVVIIKILIRFII